MLPGNTSLVTGHLEVDTLNERTGESAPIKDRDLDVRETLVDIIIRTKFRLRR